MEDEIEKEISGTSGKSLILRWALLCGVVAVVVLVFINSPRAIVIQKTRDTNATSTSQKKVAADPPTNGETALGGGNPALNPGTVSLTSMTPVDEAAYNAKMLAIANIPIITKRISTYSSSTRTSTISYVTSTAPSLWPVKNAPYPDAGALLPFDRIVAYYGNLYSTQMGILGEYPSSQVLAMLASTTAEWQAADPSTPVIPALDYIVTAAQASPGADGDYRLRMPASQIDEIIQMAQQINGIVFLDVQVGDSNVQSEVPVLAQYLKLPQVELALDPEFDMHNGAKPGTVIGSMSAADINWAANYLANIVQENNLPPKILVIHRFTQAMVTNTEDITPLPQVQIVMDMDGFGSPAKKIGTYTNVIVPYPVQFTGFKLFYKNDVTVGGHLMTPEEVLKLSPQPSYIQYE